LSQENQIPENVKDAITELKKYFEASVEHCEVILTSTDFEMELDWLIRDYNDEPHNRNEIIESHIRTLRMFREMLID